MKFKKSLALLLTGGLMAGILAGCGSEKSETTESTGEQKGSTVIKIATQSPLSGGAATIGEAIKLGAQLNLDEQKDKFKEMGFELQLVPFDDQADPKKGVANAQLIGSDKDILAIVGHFNSGVAIPSSEVYEKYAIPMVSPAVSATDVTDRGLKTVNRICARDDFQGPAGAEFAVNTLNAKKIFIIQDKTAYGSGLAEAFKKAAEEKGADILGFEGITVGEKDFNGVLNQVLSKKPDLVYFGGLYSEAGLLIKQAREKGIDIPFVGGDGMDSSTLVEIAGDAIKNTYITSLAGDSTKTEEGQKFIDKYKATFNKNTESYSVYGYDTMGLILKGIEDAIKANDNKLPSREQVRDTIRGVKNYEGVLTKASFNDIGDNEFAKVFIYSFKEAAYPAESVGEVGLE
ncbi:branched-chain amino acid ABC transporter substrate-binding protein [Bacillus sp. FJAT-29790]|uniref:branched-chain amino acid ABC transporter substrate-binding protein n=1 Tax=Bacillus sp. FJAT-29790 TaxID=1895002 RepID=UPI001C23C4E3|nr:branched-chain amino acid ABC transporter substrate-binding protein [Bacillus sp. FJAT-29790]MBU8880639.1 branched-chain amino acid ABC transporter substrate-binding protein [Bacillus sp. FJAT-29790]